MRAGHGYVSGLSASTSIMAMPVSSSMSSTVNTNVPRADLHLLPGLMVVLSPIDTGSPLHRAVPVGGDGRPVGEITHLSGARAIAAVTVARARAARAGV